MRITNMLDTLHMQCTIVGFSPSITESFQGIMWVTYEPNTMLHMCPPKRGYYDWNAICLSWFSWQWGTWKVSWTIVQCYELEFEYCPIHHHTRERLTVRPYTGRYPAHPRHPSSSPYSSSCQPQPANSFSKSWYTWS